jgi:hypothetical protein
VHFVSLGTTERDAYGRYQYNEGMGPPRGLGKRDQTSMYLEIGHFINNIARTYALYKGMEPTSKGHIGKSINAERNPTYLEMPL